VRARGRSVSTPLLVLGYAANGLTVSRFGFLVGRRIGSAVRRNRVKRRLREIVRHHQMMVGAGWDVVLIARPPAATASFAELDRTVVWLLRRARLDMPAPHAAPEQSALGDQAPEAKA